MTLVRGLSAAGALALAALPGPAFAQEAPVVATPEENLDCALWSSYMLGQVNQAKDDEKGEAKAGIASILTYFIGLYEGQTGKDITPALNARSAQITGFEMPALHQKCLPRMMDFGARLKAFETAE